MSQREINGKIILVTCPLKPALWLEEAFDCWMHHAVRACLLLSSISLSVTEARLQGTQPQWHDSCVTGLAFVTTYICDSIHLWQCAYLWLHPSMTVCIFVTPYIYDSVHICDSAHMCDGAHMCDSTCICDCTHVWQSTYLSVHICVAMHICVQCTHFWLHTFVTAHISVTPYIYDSAHISRGEELAQLVRVQGRWPRGQGYESW